LANFLSYTKSGQTGHSDLMLPGGQILAPDASALEQADPATVTQLQVLETTPYAQFTYAGEPSLVSQAAVVAITGESAIANLGWLVITHQNLAEALAPVDAQTRTMVLITLGVLGAVAGLALLLGRWLANPITRLTAVAQKIAAGDLEAQAQIESQDEIGQLTQAFNSMTSQLRGLIDSLEDQVHERTAELTLSLEVGQRASAIRDLQELLPAITELIRERFNLYYTQVYLMDDLEQNIVLKAGTGTVGEALLARHYKISVGEGSIVGWVAASGKSVVVPNTEHSEVHKPNPLLPDTRSELAVPLLVEGRVIGVLDMQADRPNTFILSSVTVFEAMATQLANSIDSAQQFALAQAAQRKAEEAVQQFTRQSWAERLAAYKGSLGFMYNLSTVTSLAAVSQPSPKREASQSLPAVRSLVAPLMVQNQSVGRLAVTAPADKSWSKEEEAFVKAVAQQLAQKAENIRLFEQTQQRAAREQLARQISDKVRTSRDIESALKTAAEELAKALGAARAAVNLRLAPKVEPDDQAASKSKEGVEA
jgi:GAF domain-containing protein/HAMP domain-containing protein